MHEVPQLALCAVGEPCLDNRGESLRLTRNDLGEYKDNVPNPGNFVEVGSDCGAVDLGLRGRAEDIKRRERAVGPPHGSCKLESEFVQ